MSVPKTDQRTWVKLAIVAGVTALFSAVLNHFVSEWLGANK